MTSACGSDFESIVWGVAMVWLQLSCDVSPLFGNILSNS